VTTHQKTPRKHKNIFTWIRQRISPFCFGIKTKAGIPIHCNKNDDIKYHFQALRMGMWGRRLSRLKNDDIADHFAGKKTHYFTADGRSSVPEVLVNIDIDCHDSGTLEGAVAFAEHLRATRFPDMYYEASTNGNGVHGYLVVVKGKLGTEALNPVLRMLDRWLKAELSKGKWDVEDVEIKGHAPEFTWGMQRLELQTYKSGQLAKLPREAMARADELRGTTRVDVDELRRLKVPAICESVDSVAPQRAFVLPRMVLVGESKNVRSGSVSCCHFGADELSKLKGSYLSLAKELLGETKLVASGRKVVTVEDLAVFLMLLRFFTNNMNADGSLPTARWEAMWKALYEAGDIDRAWCQHRFARMRNFLTKEGWLSWQEEDFVVGVYGDDGQFVPGRAAKWKGGEELMERMAEMECREVGGVVRKHGEEDQKESEERRSILYGCNELKQDDHRDEGEEKSILYGCKPGDRSLIPTPSRQSEFFKDVLDRLGIEMPLIRPRFVGYSTGPSRMAA